MITEEISLPATTPGTTCSLFVHRFGQPGARPSAYIQASLHADEIPGMLCAVTLREALLVAEARGEIAGEIILVPVANPVGLGQEILGSPLGRFNLPNGMNFNRAFPDLAQPLVSALASKLGTDGATNVALVRATLARLLDEYPAHSLAEHLKKTLMRLALSQDLVLDLHCDNEAAVHLYTHPGSLAALSPLAARLGCRAILLAEQSGGDPFDEALSRPWFELAKAAPDRPLPFACHATTVELRGQADVTHALAKTDAAAIFGFLQQAGVLTSTPSPAPAPTCAPTPLAASELVLAPKGGILVYQREVGDEIETGDTLADIIDPVSGEASPVVSPCTGVFFARQSARFVSAGKHVAKVAGTNAHRSGALLSP